jgi:hypothetical protein
MRNKRLTSPESAMVTFSAGASPRAFGTSSIALTMSMPSKTSPKTTYKPDHHEFSAQIQSKRLTCRPSNHEVTAVVMKN